MKTSHTAALALALAILATSVEAGAQVRTNLEEVSESGEFQDSRDGQTYKWISVAGKAWMAENLAFPINPGSWYYQNDSTRFGPAMGRLYTWAAARTGCPAGWHLPSEDEWQELIGHAGGSGVAGAWFKDPVGFNAPLGGVRNYEGEGSFLSLGDHGSFWTSKPHHDDHAKYLTFHRDRPSVEFFGRHRDSGNSVRCAKDALRPR